jgi:hypothetical protein
LVGFGGIVVGFGVGFHWIPLGSAGFIGFVCVFWTKLVGIGKIWCVGVEKGL